MRIVLRLSLNSILIAAMVSIIPTPRLIVSIRVVVGMLGICSASTLKSGSATVIMIPIKRITPSIIPIFLLLIRELPSFSPIIIMERSAPNVNRLIPIIRNMELIINEVITLLSRLNIEDIIVTIIHIGKTIIVVSLKLFFKLSIINYHLLLF